MINLIDRNYISNKMSKYLLLANSFSKLKAEDHCISFLSCHCDQIPNRQQLKDKQIYLVPVVTKDHFSRGHTGIGGFNVNHMTCTRKQSQENASC